MAAPTTSETVATAQDPPSNQKGQSSPEKKKHDEYNNESIGHLSGEYSCVYKLAHGKLQVGSDGLLFEGFFFFVQQRYFIDWKDVLQVQKPDPGKIDILAQNGTTATFSSVLHAERVWATLVSLHNEALTAGPHGTSRSSLTPVRAGLRRMNSEPLPESTGEGNEAAYVAAATAAHMEDLRADTAARRHSHRRSVSNKFATEAMQGDLEDAWQELLKEGCDSFSESAIQKQELSCSLDDFFELFFANGAPHSLSKFMEDHLGDTDMVVSPWKVDTTTANRARTRTLAYNHPVNAPLAPPQAKARKDQRYVRFGPHGLTIETDTYVEDVPMTDCFYVTDRILVEPLASDKSRVVLTADFDIRFVKSTMFRAIIANTTRTEFLKMFRDMLEMMSDSLETDDEKKQDKRRKSTKVSPPEAPPTNSPALLQAVIVLVVLVLACQGWMIWELQTMNQRMFVLQQQQLAVSRSVDAVMEETKYC